MALTRDSIRTGLSFGLTSGIITTLGLMVGLHSGTHAKSVIIGAILIIAIADAFSDALGIHISEESENRHTMREIWESTIATFLAKFFFASTFLVPVLLINLSVAIVVSVFWGLGILCVLTYCLAKEQGTNPSKMIVEHLVIAVIVVVTTHYLGDWVSSRFG